MALIPSESLNFPDSFRATVGWGVATKSGQPAQISRRPEPDPDKNGETRSAKATVDRTSAAEPSSNPVVPKSEPLKDKAPEKLTPSEEVKADLEKPKEDVKAEEPQLELEPPNPETKAEESEHEPEHANEEVKGEEPQKVAQEQLETKPADPPKLAPAPAVETKSEQPRDVMPEQSLNIPPSPGGATLTGADAAALLSKIFFAPAAATTELEAIKSKAQPSELPPDSETADSEANAKSSASVAPGNSQAAPEPNKELPKELAKPIDPPRREFSINAQPAALLSEGMDPERQTNTVNIQTPAQTKQVLDLIAAAAARGVLKAEPISPTPPSNAPAPTVKPAPESATPVSTVSKAETTPQEHTNVFDEIAPGPERSVLNTPGAAAAPSATTSVSPIAPVEKESVKPAVPEPGITPSTATAPTSPVTVETSQPAPKTPAKIRIQPRKFKPRPIPAPPAETELTDTEVEQEVRVPDTIAYPPVSADKAAAAPSPKAEPAKPAYREWAERGMPLPTPAESPSELFTARDVRNRWIRFGLGEFGAVAVLVLLLSYVLTHKFPDPTLKVLIFILMLAVGALAIALPIMFIRNHPSQWQRRALNYRRDHANYL